MIQENVSIPGPHFMVSRPGDTFRFSYRSQEYTLTVQEYEAQTADINSTADAGTEYPEHYVAMSYTVTRSCPDGVMTLADCDDGDCPKQTSCSPDQPEASSFGSGDCTHWRCGWPYSNYHWAGTGKAAGSLLFAALRSGGECGMADDFPRKAV